MTDEVAIAAGRAILRQGELGREFVVILEGQAEVTRDGVAVAVLGPGDHMGELALIVDHPRNATVTALTDVVAEVIDRRGFQTLIDDSPTLTRNLLRATATRLAELDDEVAELRARLAG